MFYKERVSYAAVRGGRNETNEAFLNKRAVSMYGTDTKTVTLPGPVPACDPICLCVFVHN